LSKKKYKSLVCAIALATSFGTIQSAPAYAAEADAAEAAQSAEVADAAAAEQPAEQQNSAQTPVDQSTAQEVQPTTASSTAIPIEKRDVQMSAWRAGRPEEQVLSQGMKDYVGQTIVSADIVGLDIVPQSVANNVIQSKPGDTFTVAAVEKDRAAIYDTGYFYDIYPSFEVVPEGIKITYHVLENPILRSVEITGNKMETSETLTGLIKLKTGEILNSKTLNQNVKTIEEQYRKDGYILAKVSDMNINKEGDLKLVINEGTLEDYAVKGNTKTKERVILREMRMKKGEAFNVKKARRSMQRVYNLGFFEDVNMKLNPGVEPNSVILETDVVEKRTGNFGIGAGYSSSDGIVGMISVGDTNFRGTGDSVKLVYEMSGDDTDAHGYVFSYRRPWLDSKETTGTIRIYNRTYQYDDYDTSGNLTEEYMRKYAGGEISLGRPVSEYSTNYITLRNRKDTYEKYESGTDRSGANYADWRKNNFGTTRSVTFEHITDTRDNIYNPTSGSRANLQFEYAGLGGDFNYQKYTIEDQHYIKVGHAQVIALRGQYGHGNGSIPESAQYKIGGQDSLRGYRDDQFRGNNMYLGTIEYRFPVVTKVTGAIFTDFGAAWNSGWSPEGTHHSIGVGLQIQTPVGPIRLDYGRGSNGGRVHFNIGGTF